MGKTVEVSFTDEDYECLFNAAYAAGVGVATFLANLAKERIDNPPKSPKPPAGFEFTGETRLPLKGEWFLDPISSEPYAVLANLGFMTSKCRILRPIPCVPAEGPCVRCGRLTANKLGDTWTCDDCRMAYGEDAVCEEFEGSVLNLLREIRDRLAAKDVDRRPQP